MRETIYFGDKPVDVIIVDDLNTIVTDIQYDLLTIFCNSEITDQNLKKYINENSETIRGKMDANNPQTKDLTEFIKNEKIKLSDKSINDLEKLILDTMEEYSENMDTTTNIIFKNDMCLDLYYVSNVNHIIFNKYIKFYSDELVKSITYQALCTFNNVPIENNELEKYIDLNKENMYLQAYYYLSHSKGNPLKEFYYLNNKPIKVIYNNKLKKPYATVILDLICIVVNTNGSVQNLTDKT